MAKDFRKIPINRLHWYGGADAACTLRLYHEQLKIAGPFERTWRMLHGPAQDALARMERWGALISEKNVRDYDAFLTTEIARTRGTMEASGVVKEGFNPNSPIQMKELFFGALGFKSKKKTATGQPSLDADTLQELVSTRWDLVYDAQGKLKTGAEEVAAKRKVDPKLGAVLDIMDLKDYLNQKSKYGLNYLKFVGYDGRVHTTYKLARTSRLRSNGPNLQNLTSPDDDAEEGVEDPGKRARGIFVPPEGMVMVSLDYSQNELRVAAWLSGDVAMAEAFASGTDFHTATGCRIFGATPETITKLQRRIAKNINFGVLFGQGAKGVSAALGIPEETAQGYIDAWFGVYKGFATWRRNMIRTGYTTGVVMASVGDWHLRRPVPVMGEQEPTGRPDKRLKGEQKHAENVVINTPVQGMANLVCLSSMASCVARIREKKIPAQLPLNVHDALVFYIRKDIWQEEAAAFRKIMLSHDLGIVKLKVDVEVGEENYGNMKGVTL